jgi:large subunit ribosomal protein L27
MSHKKAGGSTSLGRDSQPKMLGIKLSHGQGIRPGQIIVKQRGTKYYPGKNVKRAGDDSLISLINGIVQFSKRKMRRFDGNLKLRTIVSVITKPIAKTEKKVVKKVVKKETPKK